MMKEFRISTHTITERDNIAVASYLHEINQIESITPDEEARLARAIKKGGKEGEKAKETLIKANLRFVISVANQYNKYGMELADLISEGNIGLIKAAELYDETRGFKFISYAVWWIRQSILTALANTGATVRVPMNQQRNFMQYHQMQQKVLQEEQRLMTVEEFADIMSLDSTKALAVMTASAKATSVDTPLTDEEGSATILDTMMSDSNTDAELDAESMRQDIDEFLRKCLNARELPIIRRYYGIGCQQETIESIASSMGKSRERTRQVLASALGKLRRSPYIKQLAVYLAA